jgi:hypothetical protein
MNTSNLLLFLLTTITISCVNAQNIEWYSYNENELYNESYLPEILGEDPEHFYTYTQHKNTNSYSLEGINKVDKSSLYSIRYNADKQDKAVSIKKVALLGENIVLLTEEFNKQTKKYSLYKTIYNSKTGEIKKPQTEILFETIEKKETDYGNLHTDIHISPNKSKILIIQRFFDQNKNESIHYFNLLNQELEIIYSKANKFDEELYENESQHILDENGNLHFLQNYTKITSYLFDNEYNEVQEAIRLNRTKTSDISTIYGLQFKMNKADDLYLYGVYSDKNRLNGFSGYLYLKIDKKSNKITSQKVVPFENSFITEIEENGKGSRHAGNTGKVRTIPNLEIMNLDNGDVILKSELSRSVFYVDFDRYNVNNNDIVLSKMTTDGKLKWTVRIPKRQYFKLNKYEYAIPFFGHSLFADMDNLYLLFNDNQKNNFITQNSPELKAMTSYKSSKVSVYSISIETGSFKTNNIIRNTKDAPFFLGSESCQKKQGDIAIVFGKNGNKYSYGVFSK